MSIFFAGLLRVMFGLLLYIWMIIPVKGRIQILYNNLSSNQSLVHVLEVLKILKLLFY